MDMTMSEYNFGFPVVIEGNLSIADGTTLTIPQGEVIKLNLGNFYVYGSLVALGTTNHPIVFTSFKDDSYGGDLNGDGFISAPAPGDWYTLTLYGYSDNDGGGEFNNCIFRYGGNYYNGEYAMMYFYDNSYAYLKNSVVEYSYYAGMNATSSLVQVRNTIFRNNNQYGVNVSGSPLPDLGQNTVESGGFNHFLDNGGGYQLYYVGYTDLPAYYNNWGYYDAQQIDEQIYDDNETGYTAQVLFTPWYDPDSPPWEFNAEFTVNFTQTSVGGQLQFTDLSTGLPLSWQWDFNSDGIIDSEEQNPVWSYNQPGLYTVTLTVNNGVVDDTQIKTDYINVGSYGAADLVSINDVPGDQGGWVYVTFNRSAFDTDPLIENVEYYSIELNHGFGWYAGAYSAAYAELQYTVICHTPFDSTAYSNGLIDFRVIASMDEGTFAGDPMQGYSVDNLKPSTPDNLNYQLAGNEITISWDPSPEADFAYFAIFRSSTSGLYYGEPWAVTTGTSFNEPIGANDVYYYTLRAYDFAGNQSDASEEIASLYQFSTILPPGWSGISTPKSPWNPDVETIVQPIEPYLTILQNQSGIYWPGQNINTLGIWDVESGYLIKISQYVGINIACSRESIAALEVNNGWNLIPVLSENPADVATVFSGTDVNIVKEAAGWRIFWPEYGINTIGSLQPGKSYFALMNAVGTLNFQSGGSDAGSAPGQLPENLPWEMPVFTPGTHVVAFNTSAAALLEDGDLLAAFTAVGDIAGIGSGKVLSLFGDDVLTTEKDGFEDAEPFSLRLYKPSTGEILDIEAVFDPLAPDGSFFRENGVSVVTSLKLSPTGTVDQKTASLSIYPNPTTGPVHISGIDHKMSVTIFDAQGNRVMQQEMHTGGTLDLSLLSKGIYQIRIASASFVFTEKIILN